MRPPAPPRSGLRDRTERVAAGTLALSSAPTAPGIVLLGDDGYHAALADALADAGVHALAVPDAAVAADARAELRRRGAGAVWMLGVGAAGTEALRAAAEEDVAGVVALAAPPPLDDARAGRLRAPVLALYGGADPSIPDADVKAFYDALHDAHVLEETVVYDGAPAAFFTDDGDPQACADAWHRLLRFLGVPA